MKERVCYVALPNATHVKQFNQYEPHIYQLPDGTNVKIDKARFEIPELLFNPDYNADLFSNDSQQLGVHHLAYQSIQHVDDLAFRNGLYKVCHHHFQKLTNCARILFWQVVQANCKTLQNVSHPNLKICSCKIRITKPIAKFGNPLIRMNLCSLVLACLPNILIFMDVV